MLVICNDVISVAISNVVVVGWPVSIVTRLCFGFLGYEQREL